MWLNNRPVALLITIALAGCGTVTYDDQADQMLTSITKETNQQFIAWENKAKEGVAYDATFYDKVEADVKTLEIRMEASQDPATSTLIPVFDSLYNQYENFRIYHRTNSPLSQASFFEGERQLLNVQLASLITFELSLKPNSISGSPSSTISSTSSRTAKQNADGSNSARAVKGVLPTNGS